MVFKIEEELNYDAGHTIYRFNVVSEHDGIKIWLTDWQHKIEGMKPKRWSHIGDDGTFVKRESIQIPNEVMERAKKQVAESIYYN